MKQTIQHWTKVFVFVRLVVDWREIQPMRNIYMKVDSWRLPLPTVISYSCSSICIWTCPLCRHRPFDTGMDSPVFRRVPISIGMEFPARSACWPTTVIVAGRGLRTAGVGTARLQNGHLDRQRDYGTNKGTHNAPAGCWGIKSVVDRIKSSYSGNSRSVETRLSRITSAIQYLYAGSDCRSIGRWRYESAES